MQPALDRFRAKARSKSAGEVLQFAPAPQFGETIATPYPGSCERRLAFK
jgi:hypothetical protein